MDLIFPEENQEKSHQLVTLEYINSKINGSPASQIILENSASHVDFNILPNRPVKESIFVKEYRIWEHYIECLFDRQYSSSMEKSPDHLIFLSQLINSQKVLYVYLCHKYGFPYDPHGPELIKIWPVTINIDMPKLITKRKNLVQGFYISEPLVIGKRVEYFVRSHVEQTVFTWGKMAVYIIKEED